MIESALRRLQAYVEAEDFRGYDPYDALNARIDFQRFGKWLPVIVTQLQKRNPVNLRPFLGIRKEINPKAFGLFLTAYSNLARLYPGHDFDGRLRVFFEWLSGNSAKGFSGPCWGYNFDWANPEKYLPRYAPSVVVTAFVGKGLFDYYKLTEDDRVFELLRSSCNFILRDLHLTKDNNGLYLSYTPFKKDCCFNASLLGAELLAKVYSVTGEPELFEMAEGALDFVVANQREDGHWNYSINRVTGTQRRQIDFHQGYLLESMFEIIKHLNLSNEKYMKSLKHGARFYHREQFFASGRAKWRLPRVWPVDIHNQAQGIITFSKLASIDPNYLDFAKTIAGWTIENMQDPDGYFYYRKTRFFMNKIPYMRWSQAWMMVALTGFLCVANRSNAVLEEESIPEFV